MNKKVVIIVAIIIVLVLILVGGFFIWKNQAEQNRKDKMFSEKDLIVAEVTYKTTLDELVDKLGTPGSKREYMEGTTGDKITECIYQDGKMNIIYRNRNDEKGFVITSVSSKSNQYEFTRGLKVGDSKQKVLDAFSSESQVQDEDLAKENKIKFATDIHNSNSTGITFTIKNDVVTEISWNVQQ